MALPDGHFGAIAKRGIKTPQSDIDLIKQRLKTAEADHASRTKREPRK
jgi:phage-related protein